MRHVIVDAIKRAVARTTSMSFSQFSVTTQRWLLLVALALFIGGGYLALRRLDVDADSISWSYIAVVVLVGVPLTALMNTFEFSLSVRLIGAHTSFSTALRVSVLATAANLLPLPGGPVVRVQALRRIGGRTKETISSTALLGLVWLGLAALAAGLVLISNEASPIAWLLLLAGIVCVLSGYAMLATLSNVDRKLRVFASVLGVEALMVVVAAFRLFLILRGLGFGASMGDALVLAVSGVLASVVGVFPGGLGLREGLAAALAPLIGLAPSLGFAVAAFDRVIGILTYTPLTGILMSRKT